MIAGAVLGLLGGCGALITFRAAPPMRPIRLADRIAPYLAEVPAPSRLLARPSATERPFVVVRRVFGPVLTDVVAAVDRVVGGASSVRARLRGLGAAPTVEEFRFEQVVWGACGALTGALLVVLAGIARGGVDVVLAVVLALGGCAAGVLARDRALTRSVRRRETAMLSEFPVVADLLALSVTAGESPAGALERVCRLTQGELARDLSRALTAARVGTPLTAALENLAEQTTLDAFARFVHGVAVAIERGTPLAEVLRAQAVDVREIGKRALLESGGRKELSMLTTVVFLILPVTVLFALFPGLITLTSMTR